MLSPAEILGPSGRIAARLPNYEHRDEQLAMADAVAAAIQNRHHLVVEAGTGVGKSFAYLVPAILATGEKPEQRATKKRASRRVVISTHTISLQEQLLTKDMPLLAERDADRVHRRAGQGPAQLPQPAADEKRLGPGRGPVQRGRRVRAAPPDRGLVARHDRRLALRSALQAVARGVGRSGQRQHQLHGPQVPHLRRMFLLPGPAADEPCPDPGGQPRPVLHRPGPPHARRAACCPSTTS